MKVTGAYKKVCIFSDRVTIQVRSQVINVRVPQPGRNMIFQIEERNIFCKNWFQSRHKRMDHLIFYSQNFIHLSIYSIPFSIHFHGCISCDFFLISNLLFSTKNIFPKKNDDNVLGISVCSRSFVGFPIGVSNLSSNIKQWMVRIRDREGNNGDASQNTFAGTCFGKNIWFRDVWVYLL